MQNMNPRMNRKNYWNDEKLSCQSAEEIEKRIAQLAEYYVPEWNFDPNNPDIGGTIAKIFCKQMEGNINRYYQVLDKYYVEFINMLGLSLLPAKPAASVLALSLVKNTIPGLELYKGTKFLASTDKEDEQLIFETQHNVYITNSHINTVFMTQQKEGKILPLLGELKPVEFLPAKEQEEEAEGWLDGQEEEEEGIRTISPFSLFRSKEKGIERNALLFYHAFALDIENNNIFLQIEGNDELVRKIARKEILLYYYSSSGAVPIEELVYEEDRGSFVFQKSEENEKVSLGDGEYSLFFLEAAGPVTENYSIDRICVSSMGEATAAEGVSNATTDFKPDSFEPFTDTLALYQECYIGHNAYFSKPGAVIRLRFRVIFQENRISMVLRQEEADLRVIKRKPQNTFVEVYAQVYPEEISLEYFNGTGWKRLPCAAEYNGLFSEGRTGDYEIQFVCPGDWQESTAGAYTGKCIRLQLLKATNCYMRPAVHYYPRMENLQIDFSYENTYMDADHLISIAGTREINLTSKMKKGSPFSVFSRCEYHSDALYIGLDSKIESGPVSLFFKLKKDLPEPVMKCRYEYSSLKGFKQMKVLDETVDMSRTGVVLFLPPGDMKKTVLEGRAAYWIRICPVYEYGREDSAVWPVIEEILLNAVEVENRETRQEEEFFLEESLPGMTVSLETKNILDIDLWVNEQGQMTIFQMQKLERENPEGIRIEYDSLGEVTSCFILWEEVGQFNSMSPKRSYVLDRLTGTLHFGDGIHTALPKVLNDVSFKVCVRCCNGQAGNIEAGAIEESIENLMFVEQIYNPIKGYGGSNMESIENALKRGSNLLRSRKRMVSGDDYLKEIISYSDSIDKAKCITGRNSRNEKEERAVNFVLLLKDFEKGSYSFYSISTKLKERLLENCELTVAEEDLHIVEPIFVRISVDVWLETKRADQGFEIQNQLCEVLEEFLNPVRTSTKEGWDIGVLPGKNQIAMQIHAVKNEAVIRKIVVTAGYTDHLGEHEVDLDDLKLSPFMLCCSGRHRVQVMYI